MKLIFWGTPEFAVASLAKVLESEHELLAVITVPDRPAGRGLKLQYSDVKKFALEHQIPVLQPENLKDPAFIEHLKQLHADLYIVIAFRMLPPEVFEIPRFGTFNIHGSLLPNYRGAAPIHWAVINGETKTGVTSFFINHKMDEGDIIDFKEVTIGENETTGELYERLMALGAELTIETIEKIEKQTLKPIPQTQYQNLNLKSAPKLKREHQLINWNLTANQVHNLIRGLSPYPGAYTRIQKKDGEVLTLKCYKSLIIEQESKFPPGYIQTDGKQFMTISCKKMQISLLEVQFQGKSKMKIETFLQGFRFENYTLTLF
ncbi:MAG TPA: methionyl-tRNA formyltransferase [Bacteroidales bacterium]|nr:methionyl-tRNA formyltransferase [Bacteroidales bacterium]HQB75872.1 methionyl-tRNA formyltransferase [Bacteroidales bacterium]